MHMRVNKLFFIPVLVCTGLVSFKSGPLVTVKSQKIADTVQTGELFDASEKPKLISKQFSFTEGSSVDKKGNVFFTDQPNNKIWEYSVNGQLTLFLDSAGRSMALTSTKKVTL